MKVMALNSSPRGDGQSKTGIMLESLVEGMREAGADVELVHLRKKSIKPCAGCFSCRTQEIFWNWAISCGKLVLPKV